MATKKTMARSAQSELQFRAAVLESPEEQPAEDAPQRRVVADERHGDAVEAEALHGGEFRRLPRPSQDVKRPGGTRKGSRNRHGADDVPFHVDSAVLRARRVEPHSAQFVSEDRPIQDPPTQKGQPKGQKNARVEGRSEHIAPEGMCRPPG